MSGYWISFSVFLGMCLVGTFVLGWVSIWLMELDPPRKKHRTPFFKIPGDLLSYIWQEELFRKKKSAPGIK